MQKNSFVYRSCGILLFFITSVVGSDETDAFNKAKKKCHQFVPSSLIEIPGNTGKKAEVVNFLKLAATSPHISPYDYDPDATEQISWSEKEKLKVLIEHKADIQKRDNAGCTWLHWVTTPEAVTYLLQQGVSANVGAKIQSKDQVIHENVTPLHLAVMNEDIAKIKSLVSDKKTNINATTATGLTPLGMLFESHKVCEGLEIEFNAYASTRHFSTIDYNNSSNDQINSIVQLLVKAKANPNTLIEINHKKPKKLYASTFKAPHQRPLLHVMIKLQNFYLAHFLKEHGAVFDYPNHLRQTVSSMFTDDVHSALHLVTDEPQLEFFSHYGADLSKYEPIECDLTEINHFLLTQREKPHRSELYEFKFPSLLPLSSYIQKKILREKELNKATKEHLTKMTPHIPVPLITIINQYRAMKIAILPPSIEDLLEKSERESKEEFAHLVGRLNEFEEQLFSGGKTLEFDEKKDNE